MYGRKMKVEGGQLNNPAMTMLRLYTMRGKPMLIRERGHEPYRAKLHRGNICPHPLETAFEAVTRFGDTGRECRECRKSLDAVFETQS